MGKWKKPPKGAVMDRFRGVPYTTEEHLRGKVDAEAVGAIPCDTCGGFRAPDDPCAVCVLLVEEGRRAHAAREQGPPPGKCRGCSCGVLHDEVGCTRPDCGCIWVPPPGVHPEPLPGTPSHTKDCAWCAGRR